MFRSFSVDEMSASQFKGQLYRDHFNSWLNGSGLAVLLVESQGNPNPPLRLTSPDLEGFGTSYKAAFRSWTKGAISDLIRQCDAGKRFTYGTFGSIWMDMTLAGTLEDGSEKKKDVRIALYPTNPPPHASRTAVRIVNDKPSLVEIKTFEEETCVLINGDRVRKASLYPMHDLDDRMMYTMVIDPTCDGAVSF